MRRRTLAQFGVVSRVGSMRPCGACPACTRRPFWPMRARSPPKGVWWAARATGTTRLPHPWADARSQITRGFEPTHGKYANTARWLLRGTVPDVFACDAARDACAGRRERPIKNGQAQEGAGQGCQG